MTVLDRYIARQYLLNIAVLLVLLFSFVVVVDASLNIQRFLNLATQQINQQTPDAPPDSLRRLLVTFLLVLDLWWPRLLQLYNFVLGLVLIGAMGFTFTQLVRHREVVAILAGGISLFRLIRPIMVVAAFMVGLQILNQELVIPRIAPLILRDNTEISKREFTAFPIPLTVDGQGRLWMAHRFDPNSGAMEGVEVWERDDTGRAVRRISAPSAVYQSGAWNLRSPTIKSLRLAGGGGGGGAASGSEVAPVQITSDLDPTALKSNHFRIFSQSLSWAQLAEALSMPNVKPEVREQLTRIAWGRASVLVCIFLSLLVAIPFFLTREPRNMVLQSLRCAPVAIGSMLGSILGTAAPIPGLPVELAVFLPVLALLPVAIAMVTSMKS